MIKAVIFDFGGVLAEEGFREGLKLIARKNGIEPDSFFKTAEELVYTTGYLTGSADESAYWNAVREKTGIKGTDKELREEILKRFVIRSKIIEIIGKIKSIKLVTAILSDQTDWLDMINKKTPFYHHFDHIFNSSKIKKSKRDPSVFKDVCSAMGLKPDDVVFVDDNEQNIHRASDEGMKTVHFKNIESFEQEIQKYLPPIPERRRR